MKAIAYVLFSSAIFAFSILVNDFLLKFLRKLGTQLDSGELRWATNKKPAIGGIAFFMCFLLATISILYTLHDEHSFHFLQFYGIVGAVSLGFIAGLFDDAYSTIPWLKLLLQITCGLILSFTGTMIHVFDSDIINHSLTVFWVVGMMNAVNLLDNMDAISSIVAFFIILSCILSVFILKPANDNYLLILLGTSVALISFLRYNWWPSQIFMGDTGSMFLGVFIASFGVIYFWNMQTDPFVYAPVSARFTAIAVVFSLPIIDTSTVFVKRLFIQRKSPFKGGKDHTTHHLSYLGLSDRQVALVFAGVSFINMWFGVLIMMNAHNWNVLHILAFGSWFVLLFGFLFVITNMNTVRDEN